MSNPDFENENLPTNLDTQIVETYPNSKNPLDDCDNDDCDDGLDELLGCIQKPKTVEQSVDEILENPPKPKRKKTGGRPPKKPVDPDAPVKSRKIRSPAQIAATQKLVESRDAKFAEQRIAKKEREDALRIRREEIIIEKAVAIKKRQLKEKAYLDSIDTGSEISDKEINDIRLRNIQNKNRMTPLITKDLPPPPPPPKPDVTPQQKSAPRFRFL
jgi:hypothetical protein